MRHAIVTLLCLCAVGGGCGAARPVVVQVYDGDTGQPLAGVRVVWWDFNYNLPGRFTSAPYGVTGIDGLVISGPGHRWPTYICSKGGYAPAEVRVDVGAEDAYVASPSEGDRWARRVYDKPLQPTRHEVRHQSARPLVRVPMWRERAGGG